MTFQAIGRRVGLCERQVRRIAKDLPTTFDWTPIDRLTAVAEALTTFDELIAKAWAAYHSTSDVKAQLRALDSILRFDRHRFAFLKIVGLLELPGTAAGPPPGQLPWTDVQRQAVARALIQCELSPLVEPSLDDNVAATT